MSQIPFDLRDSSVPEGEGREAEDSPDWSERKPRVYGVSDLNHSIRNLLEGEFPDIWVRGEISNFKAHSSGHFYFSLKDDRSQMNAVMFRGFNSQLKFSPETGMEVLIKGKITVYEPRGNYQLFCQTMEPVGAGALQQAFEQLKAKLKKEGLFSREHKKALPTLPRHVALVTSPTGAAVRDMLNVLGRRFKGLKITIVPVVVQGEGAPSSIVEGLKRANLLRDVDVIIVGRGGGSMEDLWGFNDEGVARAIFGSRVPVVSAVGHEVDFTVADFVADLRASTPSVAAEVVVKSVGELTEKLNYLGARLNQYWQWVVGNERKRVQHLRQRLVDPQRTLQDLALRCDEWTAQLEQSVRRSIREHQRQVGHLGSLMDSLSPLRVLERGYAVARSEKGGIIHRYTDLEMGDKVRVQLGQGGFTAQVIQIYNG